MNLKLDPWSYSSRTSYTYWLWYYIGYAFYLAGYGHNHLACGQLIEIPQGSIPDSPCLCILMCFGLSKCPYDIPVFSILNHVFTDVHGITAIFLSIITHEENLFPLNWKKPKKQTDNWWRAHFLFFLGQIIKKGYSIPFLLFFYYNYTQNEVNQGSCGKKECECCLNQIADDKYDQW